MHRHENRAVQSLRIVVPDGEVSQELSIPRKSRRIDLMYVLPRVEPVFGPWGAVLRDRPVIIELYSGFPTRSNLYGASAKWGHCAEEWSGRNRRKATRDLPERALNTSKPPVCLILASRVSQRASKAIPGIQPLNMPGAWATPDLDQGGYLLLDQSALPDTPGMSFLRWLETPTNSAEARRRLHTLLGDEEIPILTRTKLHEAIMNQTIGTNEERRSAYEVAIDLGGALALQKAILNLIERNGLSVSTAQRDRLLACEDLTVLNELLLRAITADSVDVLFADL